jgi:hypothetical protein
MAARKLTRNQQLPDEVVIDILARLVRREVPYKADIAHVRSLVRSCKAFRKGWKHFTQSSTHGADIALWVTRVWKRYPAIARLYRIGALGNRVAFTTLVRLLMARITFFRKDVVLRYVYLNSHLQNGTSNELLAL